MKITIDLVREEIEYIKYEMDYACPNPIEESIYSKILTAIDKKKKTERKR